VIGPTYDFLFEAALSQRRKSRLRSDVMRLPVVPGYAFDMEAKRLRSVRTLPGVVPSRRGDPARAGDVVTAPGLDGDHAGVRLPGHQPKIGPTVTEVAVADRRFDSSTLTWSARRSEDVRTQVGAIATHHRDRYSPARARDPSPA
jgi:hypothetical protein